MKKIAVLTMHGMGKTGRNYAKGIHDSLAQRVGEVAWNESVYFHPIYYQDILQGNQNAVWARTKGQVDWKKLRQFFLFSFSDATSLESNKAGDNSAYYLTQSVILDALTNAYHELEKAGPLVIIAHSLGCQVISNYLWDASRPRGASAGVWQKQPAGIPVDGPLNRFARGKTLRRLFTTGCNIPIFVAGQRDIRPIPKPNKAFQWHNYYDEDDVLGWPLRPLSARYRKLVNDHEINAGGGLFGGVMKSWNPLSHGEYWDDGEVLGPVSSFIRSKI
ncbi:MAG: hypothetical protein HKN08_07685 [Gammaproteobacteria bacterium]|nr:hypothetical protein [Gammaproteobacteria bacterium]